MSRLPAGRTGQSFIEYALMIILIAIVVLSILLILGDDLRTLINDLLQMWFPAQGNAINTGTLFWMIT
jgi:Flp pilus assembly pilin Flp